MSVTTEESEYEKMNLKEFGNHLVEMSKDLKYMGHEMRDSIRKPLNTYLNSTRNKSDVESLCGHVGNLLETARLNIDHYIETLRKRILNTEDNTVLQGICKKLESYTVNPKLDRDHNLNRVEVGVNTNPLVLTKPDISENPTTIKGPVYDDRLQKEFEEARKKATDASTSDSHSLGLSEIPTVEPKEENESAAIVERDGGNIEEVRMRENPDLEQEGVKPNEDLESICTQKAESFTLDIEEHELPPFSSKKSDSQDTIITSPTQTKALIDSHNCFVDYERSTIPDNTSLSEKLRDVENFLESDSGRQSQNNSDSEDDIVNKPLSTEQHSKSKKTISQKGKTSLKENKTPHKNSDDKSTENETAEPYVRNTKETSSKNIDAELSDPLLRTLSEAISKNSDTKKNTAVEADKNPPVSDAPELESSESLNDPPQNAGEDLQNNLNKHNIEKELRVNLDNIDITPEKFSDEHVLQSRDTVKRKLINDDKGVADDTFIEDEKIPIKKGSEDIDTDQESIKSFVFNLRDQYGDFMDVNEGGEITISPRKLSTESESNKENSDEHSDICVTHKKNLRKLDSDTSDNEGVTDLKSQDSDSEKDENMAIPQSPQDAKNDSDRNSNIGDKSSTSLLYDVMREEDIPDKASALSPSKRGRRKSELREAEEIYKNLLIEESDVTDVSDSDDSLSSVNIDTTDLDSGNSYEELFSLHGLKKCSVKLERIKLDDSLLEQAVLHRGDSDTDSDIDRLCDINNILKRKGGSSIKKHSRRKRRKKSAGSSCASGLERSKSGSDSDATNASGDSDIMASLGVRPLSFSSTALPMDEDELLADALCEKMSGGSSSASSEDSGDEKKDKKAAKKGSGEKAEEASLSKEELERRAWRKDSLLRGNIDTESESDTDLKTHNRRLNEKINARFKKFKSKPKSQTVSDSDSDVTNLPSEDLRDFKNKIDSRSQKEPKTGSDSESSEIEFVAVPRTPKKSKGVINISDDDGFEETTPTKGKGRRNIRALVSDENLAESTQKAQAEENERIARLEERKKIKETFTQSFASQGGSDEDCLVLDMDKNTLTPLIQVHSVITSRLKPHQKEGVQFMWESCYESVEQLKKGSQGSGCILAHCMGLGKTLQALALIHTIFAYELTKTKHVLVVCPLSTVPNWKNEFNLAFAKIKGCKIPLHIIHANKNLTAKYEVVRKWYKKGGMLVLGYEAFGNLTDHSKLDKYFRLFKDDILEALVDPGPDLVICDEGHLLRNKSSRRTLSLNKIKAKRRIVLTGTPLQNNLLEYYHMVNFVKPNLLGTEREYKTNFVNPITNGQYEDSTAEDIKLMKYRTHILHRKLKKTVQRVEDTELKIYLPNLVDYGVFIQLHKLQVDIYKTYLDIALSRIEKSKKTFLSDVQILKYVGSHPHVLKSAQKLSHKKIKEEDVIDENDKEKVDEALISNERWWKSLMPEDVADVIEYGNKFQVVMSLIEECESIGDKMLIFSQNYAEMDSLEHFLKIKSPSKWRKKTDYYRMDGTVPPEERTAMCDNFNNKKNKTLRLFIMSTKVGGLGLNLTGANRVIIMNVNWNPSYDTQSVFRTFRFGQEKEVFVYRLICMDTMEEKIYQRQVTKLAIAHRVVDKHQITRHYNSTDILELYTVEPNADDERPVPNLPTDAVLAKVLQKHAFVFRWHEHQQLLANRPEEDLNEAEKNAAWEEFNRKATEPPLTIHPPFPSFGPNVSATQRSGFLMASMLPRPAAGIGSTRPAFLPGTNFPGSSVANMNNLPNNMKINSVQGLDSPSEDHDYCLPKPSPFSIQAKPPTTVSAQPPPIRNSTAPTHSSPKLNTIRKLIFSHNSKKNVINSMNAQFNKNVPPQVTSNPLNPLGRSVLVSSSQGKVTISSASNASTLPSSSMSNVTNGTPNLTARPATLTAPTKVTNNDINTSTLGTHPISGRRKYDPAQALYLSQMKSGRISVPPLIKYPNNNITSSATSKPINLGAKSVTETNQNNKEQDPLFIDPKLVGSSVPMAMSYKEAVSLAEKWSNAKKKADTKAIDPLRKIQKTIQKRTHTHSPKLKINPSSSASNIHQPVTNNFTNIVSNITLKNRPAVSLTKKSNAVSGIPTTKTKPINANVLARKPPVGIEVSKIPAGLAKKSNKENKKAPVSLINLVDEDVIPVPLGSPNSAPLSNNEIVKNLKEISINKVQKDKNAKNVIRLD